MNTHSSGRRLGLLCTGVFCILQVMIQNGSAQTVSPIIPGKWAIKRSEVRNRLEGSGTSEGLTISVQVDMTITGTVGDSIQVQPDGTVSGQVSDQMTGTYHFESSAPTPGGPEGSVVMDTTQTGFEVTSINGVVKTNASGAIEFHVKIQTVSGTLNNQGQMVVKIPLMPPQTQPINESWNAANDPMDVVFEVKDYDPAAGTMSWDWLANRWVQDYQDMANQITGGSPIPLTVTYEGETEWENKTPTITSVTPQYTQYYLKDVMIGNDVTTVVDWRNGGTPREVTLTYGGTTYRPPVNGNSAVERGLEMGETFTEITAVATADGVSSEPFILPLIKVDVPAWAGTPADFTGAPGIVYTRSMNWPTFTATASESIQNLPLIGGAWRLFGSASSTLNLAASSEGNPTDGSLNGTLGFEIPFVAGAKITWTGVPKTTLSAGGMTMRGENATVQLPTWSATKSVSVLDLLSGGASQLCIHPSICAVLGGPSVTFQASIGGTGSADFQSTDTEIEFTRASVNGRVSGSATLSLVPPPADFALQVLLSGGGAGCVNVELHPNRDITDLGGTLTFSATVSFLFTDPKTFAIPVTFGSQPCSGPVRPGLHRLMNTPPEGSLPADAQIRFALGRNGRSAMAWTQVRTDSPRPSADIRIAFWEGTSWSDPIAVTDDTASDQAPAIIFDRHDQLLVCWQRNAAFSLPNEITDLALFAAGFEMYSAVIDPETRTVSETEALTTNGQLDFGAQLRRGADGTILLGWQESRGESFLGTPSDPASIWAAFWNGSAWSEPALAAADLIGTYGWNLAIASAERAVVAITSDPVNTDGTDFKPEIFVSTFQNGAWGAAWQLTDNDLIDWAPQPVYLPGGKLALAWLQDEEVVGVVDPSPDTAITPATWIAADKEPGIGFSHAQVVVDSDHASFVWPRGHDLAMSAARLSEGSLATGQAWSSPVPLQSTPELERSFAVAPDGVGGFLVAADRIPVFDGDVPGLGLAAFPDLQSMPVPDIEDPTDPNRDRDGDGAPDWAEELAGTDPLDSLSVLRVVGMVNDLGELTLRWKSVPGKSYRIVRSIDLLSWEEAGEVEAVQNESSFRLNAERTAFYRVGIFP